MKVNHIIATVCITLMLLFASGADQNPLWVTLLGMLIPMGILHLINNID